MPEFNYSAKSGPGKILTGVLTANSRAGALHQLRAAGYYPLSIEMVKETSQRRKPWQIILPERGIRSREAVVFLRQFADLLYAGMTLQYALQILMEQAENPGLRVILRQVAEAVRDGKPLSEALAAHPKMFSPLVVSTVRAGEVGGFLDQALAHLADIREKELEIRGKVLSALAYPLFLAGIGLLTVAVLLLMVVPQLAGLFHDLGQTLPLPTRALIFLSNLLYDYGWLGGAALVVTLLVLHHQRHTPRFKRFIDRVSLGIPLYGGIIQKYEIARLSRTLAALLENGVTSLRALAVARATLRNHLIAGEIEMVEAELTQGGKIGQGLRKGKIFPVFVTNMIAVGEESNQLEKTLTKVAESYEAELERKIKTLTSLLEPLMVLLVGLFVGFIALAIMLPIFEINLTGP